MAQAVTEVLNKSHFSLQMGNCPIPVAEHSGLCRLYQNDTLELYEMFKKIAKNAKRRQDLSLYALKI